MEVSLMKQAGGGFPQLLAAHEREILEDWQKLLKAAGALQTGRIKEAELDTQCRTFLAQLKASVQADGTIDKASSSYAALRTMLGEISSSRAIQGFSPSETATFVFSLKQPLFNAINKGAESAAAKVALVWQTSLL